jgi:hypothetical protein
MVIPLVIAGGIALGSAIMQYMNSQEGRELAADERAKLEALLAKVQDPQFDASALNPEDYRVVQQYVPQGAPFIEEVAPQITKAQSEGAKTGREAQMNALGRLSQLSTSDRDPLMDLQASQALQKAGVANQGRVGAITESFARRGQGGGPQEMLAQMLGSQQSNEMANQSMTNLAVEAQRRKLQALADSAQLGGQIRGEDVALESRNNDILNQFNQRFAARRQGWEDARADMLNDAQRANIDRAQGAADRNVSTRNQFAVDNRNRYNDVEGKKWGVSMDRLGRQSNLGGMARDDIAANTNAQNQAVSGASGAAISGLDRYYGNKKKPQDDEGAY